jgi:hypothetical protein
MPQFEISQINAPIWISIHPFGNAIPMPKSKRRAMRPPCKSARLRENNVRRATRFSNLQNAGDYLDNIFCDPAGLPQVPLRAGNGFGATPHAILRDHFFADPVFRFNARSIWSIIDSAQRGLGLFEGFLQTLARKAFLLVEFWEFR